MNKTDIEWCDYSWNPLAMLCKRCSDGCRDCWHLKFANRLAKNPAIRPERRAAYAGETGPLLIPEKLYGPARKKKPSKIAVQLMGDLFLDSVPTNFIDDIMGVMLSDAPHHKYFILTKRPERMAKLISKYYLSDNIYVGVTICNQQEANEKIPQLLSIPGACKYWISLEPMLGPVDLDRLEHFWTTDALTGEQSDMGRPWEDTNKLDFIALGTESINGRPGRQPHTDDIRSVRDQCGAAGVKFMLKQMAYGDKMVSKPHLDGRQHLDQL